MVIYPANSYTYYYQFSITHSLFHSRLKTFLFCKSFPLQPFFFFFRTDYMDSPDFTVTSERTRFRFLVFRFTLFNCCFRAHVKIASRIVSHREPNVHVYLRHVCCGVARRAVRLRLLWLTAEFPAPASAPGAYSSRESSYVTRQWAGERGGGEEACSEVDRGAEADLGMFSMFGRTGAPTKGGLQKNNFFHFLQHGNKPEILK